MGISMDVIFCDETLPDGGYQDLLRAVRAEHRAARFVALFKSREGQEHFEALRLGATNVFAGSYQPDCVEQILNRAERNTLRKQAIGTAASA